MERNRLKPAAIVERMRIAVSARRVSNWLTGLRSPNVSELDHMLRAVPDEDARALVAAMAQRWRDKH